MNIIACPSCARQGFNVIETVELLEERLAHVTTPMCLSIIGCVVNGPGEALMTDLGFTGGGKGAGMVYVAGKPDHKLDNAGDGRPHRRAGREARRRDRGGPRRGGRSRPGRGIAASDDRTEMPDGMLRIALVIGLLAAVGPFAIDMYLPALPQVAADLGATAQATQLTLTAFFVAFGVSQLVYGPLSDQYGRKPPLYAGLGIFLVGTLGCALAPSIGALVAARFVQGLGAATVMVVPRAIIRDLHTGPAATRLMAAVMLVISVSPMLAPLAGSGLMLVAGWRAIFGVLAAAGFVSLALTAFALPETLPRERRTPARASPP